MLKETAKMRRLHIIYADTDNQFVSRCHHWIPKHKTFHTPFSQNGVQFS